MVRSKTLGKNSRRWAGEGRLAYRGVRSRGVGPGDRRATHFERRSPRLGVSSLHQKQMPSIERCAGLTLVGFRAVLPTRPTLVPLEGRPFTKAAAVDDCAFLVPSFGAFNEDGAKVPA